MSITPEQFTAYCNREPQRDDLDRTNCPEAGMPGHRQCGMCPEHSKPRIECGCTVIPSDPHHEPALDFSEPRDLERYAKQVGELRIDALFEESSKGLGPIAQSHFCIALDLLSQANHHLLLASATQARDNAIAFAARNRASGPDP